MPGAAVKPLNRAGRRHPDQDGNLPDELWDLARTAAFFHEHPRSTRRRVARGELGCITLPGSRRLLFNPVTVRSLAAVNERVGR